MISSSGFVPAPTPALATTSAGQILQTASRMAGGDPAAIGSYADEAIKTHALRILALARDLDGIRAQLGDSWSAGAMSVSTGGALLSGIGQLSTHSDNAVQATGAITKGAETLSAIQSGYQMVTSVAEPIVAALLSNPYTAAGGYAYGQATSTAVSTVTDLLGSLISKIASTALNAFVTSMVEQGVQSLMADDPPQVTASPYPASYPGAAYPATYPGAAYPATYPGTTDPGLGTPPTGYSSMPTGYSSMPTAAPYSVPGLTSAAGLPHDGSSYAWPTGPETGATPWTAASALPPWLDGQDGDGHGNGNGNGDGRGDGRGDGGQGHGNGQGQGHGNGQGHGHEPGGGQQGDRRHHHGHDVSDDGRRGHRGEHGGRQGDAPGRGDDGTEITIAAADEQVTIHVDGNDPTTIHTHLGGAAGNDFEITVAPDRR